MSIEIVTALDMKSLPQHCAPALTVRRRKLVATLLQLSIAMLAPMTAAAEGTYIDVATTGNTLPNAPSMLDVAANWAAPADGPNRCHL